MRHRRRPEADDTLRAEYEHEREEFVDRICTALGGSSRDPIASSVRFAWEQKGFDEWLWMRQRYGIDGHGQPLH